jgi:protein SCO1/2
VKAFGVTVAALLWAVSPASAQTANDPPPQLREVRIEQKLNSKVPLDLQFTDSGGKPVHLRELISEKPVILSLVYYGCPRLCSMILTGLLRSMRALPLSAGEEFDVVTVSFDPRETPKMAAAKKLAYMEGYDRPGAADGWHFLTGSEREIERLANAVGFKFQYDPKTDQFSHASAIMVLTPEGRVSRYFYGIEYPPRDLRLGIIEASQNKIGSPVDQVLLYCFHYDPETGKYSLAIMNVIRLFGAITVLMICSFILIAVRWDRNRKRSLSPEGVLT